MVWSSCYSVVCQLPSGAWGWQQGQRFEFLGVLAMAALGSNLLPSLPQLDHEGTTEFRAFKGLFVGGNHFKGIQIFYEK
jgi:hypothetical protein